MGRWLLALLLALGFGAGLEVWLGAKGFRATVLDSEARWQAQRARATALGSKALAIVGGSRIQLGLDLGLLRRETGLRPVQLAIDGSSFVPVLRGLADDPDFTGTVLVDYYDDLVADWLRQDRAAEYQARLPGPARFRLPTSADSEGWLAPLLRDRLRAYADGGQPLKALLTRALATDATPQYLVTLADRSRLADYRQVPMPAFYHGRVIRNLGAEGEGLSPHSVTDAQLRERIARLRPQPDEAFLRGTSELKAMVEKIQARGGKVVFVVMPVSGLVRDIERSRYPRVRFWRRFAEAVPAGMVHFEEEPGLSAFQCPDGSHLDMRDQARFTEALVGVLMRKELLPGL